MESLYAQVVQIPFQIDKREDIKNKLQLSIWYPSGIFYSELALLMLVTDVGDEMCWRQLWFRSFPSPSSSI